MLLAVKLVQTDKMSFLTTFWVERSMVEEMSVVIMVANHSLL